MKIKDQNGSDNLNLELTQLRGDNEAMTKRIESLTKIVEALVAVQVKNQDPTDTPMAKEEIENYLIDEESKTPIDPSFTRMAGRLKFTDRDYSDDGSVERRISIYARGEDKERMLKPMQKTQKMPEFSWQLTSLRFNPITVFFSKI